MLESKGPALLSLFFLFTSLRARLGRMFQDCINQPKLFGLCWVRELVSLQSLVYCLQCLTSVLHIDEVKLLLQVSYFLSLNKNICSLTTSSTTWLVNHNPRVG